MAIFGHLGFCFVLLLGCFICDGLRPRAVSRATRPNKVDRRQLCRPRRRHALAGLATVEFPLEVPLAVDPVGEPRVLGPARRHLAVAVLRLVLHQLHELRLPLRLVRAVLCLLHQLVGCRLEVPRLGYFLACHCIRWWPSIR